MSGDVAGVLIIAVFSVVTSCLYTLWRDHRKEKP